MVNTIEKSTQEEKLFSMCSARNSFMLQMSIICYIKFKFKCLKSLKNFNSM